MIDKQLRDRRKKPSKGIIIFSSILILFGTVNFLFIIISFFQLRLELQLKDMIPNLFYIFPHSTINFTIFWLSTIVSLLIMLVWIVSGIGLFLLKEWARQLLLISTGVYFLNKAVDIIISISLVRECSANVPIIPLCAGIFVVLSFSVSIINFFSHPSVINQFKQSKIVSTGKAWKL